MRSQVPNIVVRNERDASRAVEALSAGSTIGDVRFEGWPVLVFEATNPIRSAKSAIAVSALQTAIEKQYCYLKYGRADRRHLTEMDRVAVGVDVHYSHDNRRIIVDMSNAANAAVHAISTWTGDGPNQTDIFEQESWPRTVREPALAAIRRLTSDQIKAIATLAVVVGGLVWTAPVLWKEGLTHLLERQKVNNEHQLKLAELERTMILSETSAPAKLAMALDREAAHVAHIVRRELQNPIVHFVVSRAESVRPALLDMAPYVGTININGLEIPAATARAAAKSRKHQTIPAWTTTVKAI